MLLGELLQAQPFLPYLRGGDFACRPPWHFPERRLLDYLLVYFQEGHCLFEVDGVEYHFYPGDFCLAQPGSLKVMRGLTPTVTPYAHLDIFYHPLRAESFATGPGQTDLSEYIHLMQPRLNDLEGISIPVRLAPKDPELFANTLLKTIASWLNPNPLAQMETQMLASQLVVSIIDDHTDLRIHLPEPTPSFRWLPSYLSLHMAESVSVEEMARRASLSVSRFREVFKHNYGMPPHRYLLRLRLKHARELLRNTDYSVEKIAEYCGFSDIHHFSKTFKKEEGATPREYRNRHKA